MAIRDLQAQLTELGRIRTGLRVPNKAGTKLIPKKLDSFRFTSPAEHLITAIAALYGGECAPWTGEGVVGRQFQVFTDVDDITVYVPRQKIDPFYERWQGGVCARRCDGERDLIHDKPCDCSGGDDRLCKPTTRINVMLADVPGIGVWRLESHGIYAAMELSQLAMLVERTPMPIPARLILEARQRKFYNLKKDLVEVRDYYVPIVMIDAVTSRQVQIGGDAITQALRMSASTEGPAQIAAAPAARAIEAAPAAPAGPDPALIERGLAFIAQVQPAGVDDAWARVAKMGSPAVLVQAMEARVQALADHAEQMREVPNPDGERVVEMLERLRTAAPTEMGGLWDHIEAMGLPDLAARAWRARRDVLAAELLERIRVADAGPMNLLRDVVEQLGSPDALVSAWEERRVQHEQRDAALAQAWEDEQQPPQAHPSHLSGPAEPGEEEFDDEPPVATPAVEPPGEGELAERKAAMLELVAAAGPHKLKVADINKLINDKFGVVATGATAEQLRSLTAELKERKP